MSLPVAFEELYRANFAFVWRSLCRLGCPRVEVADAAQDVFLVAYRKLGDFEGRSSLRTWLFGICYRHVLERRRVAARHRVAAPEVVDALTDGAPSQAELVELGEQKATLERILDQLSVEQRAVFTLHELEGLEGEDIATVLGIPLGTAYSRLRSARAVFRRAIQQRRARDGFEHSVVAGAG